MITKEQFLRHKNYWLSFLRHLTWRKLVNFVKAETRLRTRHPSVEGLYPYILFMEMSHYCNLQCPLCRTGLKKQIPRKSRMTFETYVKTVEPLKDYLFIIFLYNLGEPFLNPDIQKIIKWNTDANISSVISSNLNLPIDARALVQSRLEFLIISGDGITQEVYEKYRVGGKLDKVFDNLENIAKAKKETGSKFPVIEWQCLVNRWNEPQLEEITKTVYRKGVDQVRFGTLNYYPVDDDKEAAEKEWAPKNPLYRGHCSESKPDCAALVRKPCYYLWRTAIVNVDGAVAPCCLYDIPSWGNAFDEGFLNVWNNETYKEARRRFCPGGGKKPGMGLVCDGCTAPFLYK
jgi:MoaA/NifB/PqqE/SkfB family radical SAM enzyme